MKSFTLHKVDAATADRLEQQARRERVSVNRLAKRLLRSALGLDKPEPANHRAEFEDLFGTWSEEEAKAFQDAVEEFGQVNPADWR